MKAVSLIQTTVRSAATVRTTQRSFATAASAIRFKEHGDPKKVLSVAQEPIPTSLKANEVLVKMLAAPVHKADLANVRGAFGKTGAVPGVEGVGVVIGVGSGVSNLKENDRVVTINPTLGTWRTHVVSTSQDFVPIPSSLILEAAATLTFTPLAALGLFDTYASKLQAGDYLIQDNAGSAIGTHIAELANEKGLKSINIVPNDPDYSLLVSRLQAHGAYIAISPEYHSSYKYKELLEGNIPKLAFSSSSGPISTQVARSLAPGGTFVSYGNTSGQPLIIPTSLLHEREITFKGFNFFQWLQNQTPENKVKLIQRAANYAEKAKLRTYVERHRFTDLAFALDTANNAGTRKVLLVFDENQS